MVIEALVIAQQDTAVRESLCSEVIYVKSVMVVGSCKYSIEQGSISLEICQLCCMPHGMRLMLGMGVS